VDQIEPTGGSGRSLVDLTSTCGRSLVDLTSTSEGRGRFTVDQIEPTGGRIVQDQICLSKESGLEISGTWSQTESLKSSTWRELEAIHRILRSLGNSLKTVRWFTDNRNVCSIIYKGS